ncbi:histone H1-like [Chenopodium quinoa]|uniref:histone H1-like n=1 Tax=Chenopodium quinoa TaxID=63459 RepID=UPI000B78F057|nr:histone H1-like [Chenopodium quinoa]
MTKSPKKNVANKPPIKPAAATKKSLKKPVGDKKKPPNTKKPQREDPVGKKASATKEAPKAKKISPKKPADSKKYLIKGAKLQRISKKQILIKRKLKELQPSKGL